MLKFRDYLKENSFKEELAALELVFECSKILERVIKSSENGLLNDDVDVLHEMALQTSVNLDSKQLKALESAKYSKFEEVNFFKNYFWV